MGKYSLVLLAMAVTNTTWAKSEVWTDQVPAHNVACAPKAVAGSDGAAINSLASSVMAELSKANLIPGAIETIATSANPPTVKVCLQLGTQTLPNGSQLIMVPVSERPAAFALCDPSTLAACRSDLVQYLGSDWRGQLYVVPVFRWVSKNGNQVGPPPTRKLLAQTAAALNTTSEPDPDSALQETDLLLVAPAPGDLSQEDLQKKIAQPISVAPH